MRVNHTWLIVKGARNRRRLHPIIIWDKACNLIEPTKHKWSKTSWKRLNCRRLGHTAQDPLPWKWRRSSRIWTTCRKQWKPNYWRRMTKSMIDWWPVLKISVNNTNPLRRRCSKAIIIRKQLKIIKCTNSKTRLWNWGNSASKRLSMFHRRPSIGNKAANTKAFKMTIKCTLTTKEEQHQQRWLEEESQLRGIGHRNISNSHSLNYPKMDKPTASICYKTKEIPTQASNTC